ncbi:hypothetical protein Acin_1353 [Acidaminococcus intestini RyC-MR95]|uniref:Uncharacterized protein n=1 Tax=Acidaminococcus intestini (strain RyC-MR95) TaxID=568816 RepID=G4Q974_ACIIR|nr:hypothetical protein Acin_1353 [Acidaminococcus intestini RyC-MR95]
MHGVRGLLGIRIISGIKKGPMASSLGPYLFLADYSISYRSL